MVGKVVGKSKVKDVTKVLLDVDEIPKQWYNIVADLPEKLPPALNPATPRAIKGIGLGSHLSKRADQAGNVHRAFH